MVVVVLDVLTEGRQSNPGVRVIALLYTLLGQHQHRLVGDDLIETGSLRPLSALTTTLQFTSDLVSTVSSVSTHKMYELKVLMCSDFRTG